MSKILGPIGISLAWMLALPCRGIAAGNVPPQMRLLAEQEGTWNVTFYVLDASQEWQTSRCTATMRMVLDGAAQAMDFQGVINDRKYYGTGLTCFDRETGSWQSTWADNQGGRITLYRGEWKGKDFVLEGDERAEGQEVHSRITSTNVGPKHFEWRMDISTGGKEYRTIARATYDKR